MISKMHQKIDATMMAAFEQDQLRIVRNGHIVQIYDADLATGIPSMACTIGLCQRSLPELLLIGPEIAATNILDTLASMLYAGELKLEPGSIVQVAPQLQVKIGQISQAHAEHFMSLAYWFGESIGRSTSFLQVLTPDANGRFPNESDCDALVGYEQNLSQHYYFTETLRTLFTWH